MATIEEKTKELDELYTKATTKEEYHRAWEMTKKLEQDIAAERGILVKWSAQAILNGFWARYYELLNFNRTGNDINEFCHKVANYYHGLEEKEDIDLKVSYGYLFSVITSQLEGDLQEAEKIDEEISQLAEKSGNVVSALRSVNAQGLNAMKKKDYPGAIAIFDKGWRFFPEHKQNPETLRHFGNICNNRGLSEIHLSGQVQKRSEKIKLLWNGIQDLTLATSIYTSEDSPPLKHLKGIKNRLKIAQIRCIKILSIKLFRINRQEIKRVDKLLKDYR